MQGDEEADSVQKRLQVLQLAETLGSVSQACKQVGLSRSQFYVYKRRFEIEGIAGLQNRPPIAQSIPQKTPRAVLEKILLLSSLHPRWGCERLSKHLQAEGIAVSSPTVQKILIQHQLGRRQQRILRLEEQVLRTKVELTFEQITVLEKFNPCFCERDRESKKPGQLLAQHIEKINVPAGRKPFYLHVVVDTYNSYAFCALAAMHQVEDAISLLDKIVLPFYKDHGLQITTIQMELLVDFTPATWRQPNVYESYLKQNNLSRDFPQRLPANGFVERFLRTVKDEFFLMQLDTNRSRPLKRLQTALNKWLHTYNHRRSHQGYRNYGQPPAVIFNAYLRRVRKAR